MWWSGEPLCCMYTLTKVIGYLLTNIDNATTRSQTHCTQLIWFFHLLSSNIANPCLLMNFLDSNMMWPCCVSQISLPWRHVSEIKITSHVTWCNSLNNSSFLSLECMYFMFFCRTMNFAFPSFSSLWVWGETLLLLPLHAAPVNQVSVTSIWFASAFSIPCTFLLLLLAVFSTLLHDCSQS